MNHQRHLSNRNLAGESFDFSMSGEIKSSDESGNNKISIGE